jgi:hypothetical protein
VDATRHSQPANQLVIPDKPAGAGAIRNLLLQLQKKQIIRRILRLTLRAIGFADVRFGILPSQSGFRRDGAAAAPE